MLLQLLTLLALDVEAAQSSDVDEIIQAHSDDPYPDYLNPDTFDTQLSSGYHLVEFFSPYCPHCTHFAPTWATFYYGNHKNLEEKSHLSMNQVDCVASGELCDREGIAYYPQIRFYGPGSKFLATMDGTYQRSEDGLGNFIEDELHLWTDEQGDFNSDTEKAGESASESDKAKQEAVDKTTLLDRKTLVRMLAGEGMSAPALVSFWPSTDKELNDQTFQSDHKSLPFFKKATRCYAFRNLWNNISRRLSREINDGALTMHYFNCGSSPLLCESLKIKDFSTRGVDSALPKVMMILPTSAGGNRIVYNEEDPFQKQDLASWTSRLLQIYKFDDISKDKFKKLIKVQEDLKPKLSEVPDFSRVGFILLEDPDTKASEDSMILSQILQPFMDIKENIYLYRSTDKDNFIWMLKEQEQHLENGLVNRNLPDDSTDMVKFNNEMFAARTLSTFPMLACFKANSLTTPVYKSFSPKDIRDPEKVMQFIRENASPTIRALTHQSMDEVFPSVFDPEINDKTEKVLITLMDMSKPKKMYTVAAAMEYIYNKYTYLKWKHQFEKLDSARAKKYKQVAKLKAKDADYMKIMSTMTQKIPSVFDRMDDDLKVVYVDVDRLNFFKHHFGWADLPTKSLEAGDCILVTRFGNTYWSHGTDGEQLNIDRQDDVVDLIAAASFKRHKGSSLAMPWFKIIGLIFLIICGLCLSLCWLYKLIRRRGIHANRIKGLGLLDRDPDLDSTELSKFE